MARASSDSNEKFVGDGPGNSRPKVHSSAASLQECRCEGDHPDEEHEQGDGPGNLGGTSPSEEAREPKQASPSGRIPPA